VAAVAMQMRLRVNHFAHHAAALLVAHIRIGLRCSCSAVMRCKLPNNALRKCRCGQRDAEPADVCAEEWKQPAGCA